MPEGLRTKIREIMQTAHFVLPDSEAAEKGLRQVEEIRTRLYRNVFRKTLDYCEAKSLAMNAALILREASKGGEE